jgi:hypothetical protein
MMGLGLLLLLLSPLVMAELLVELQDEDDLNAEVLHSDAELVRSYHRPGLCQEVEEEVRVFRYFLKMGPVRREKNVSVVVSGDSVVDHQYPGRSTWVPQRQRIV